MKKVTLSLLLLGALTLLSQQGVYAEGSKVFEKKLVAERSEHTPGCESLKFTDAQLESIHAIKSKYLDADEPNISQLHRLHRKLFELMSGLNVDKEDLMLVQSKMNAIEAELSNQRLRMALELRDVLTAEQKADIHKHMLEWEAAPGGPKGPGGLGRFEGFEGFESHGGHGGGFPVHGPGGSMMPPLFGPGMPAPGFLPPPGMPGPMARN
jgi:Spy/CpxP family protein refolding chaperone